MGAGGWGGVAWVVSGVMSVGLLLALRGLVAKPPWLWVVGGVRGCGACGYGGCFDSPMKGKGYCSIIMGDSIWRVLVG